MSARILIVEDDPDLLQLMSVTLERAGHVTRTAANGREGLEAALAQPPDLIITDVMMPEMDGWELVRQLRAHADTSFVPVVFLTVLNDKESRLRGFQLGADDYFAKPFAPLELVVRANAALQKAQSERTLFDTQRATGDLQGKLATVGAPSVLTLLEQDCKTGLLEIRAAQGECSVALRQGRILRASILGEPEVGTEECIYRLVGWTEGTFEFVEREMTGEQTTRRTLAPLLLEGARRMDESER